MFADVSQYTDFVIGVVGKYEGRYGRPLLDLIEWCAISFEHYNRGVIDCVCKGKLSGDVPVGDGGTSDGSGKNCVDAGGKVIGGAGVACGGCRSHESAVGGDSGMVMGVRGKNYEKNCANRARRKALRVKAVVVPVGPGVAQEELELQRTMKKKWMAENLLAAECAEKKLAEMKECVVTVDVVSPEEQVKQVEKIRADTARIRKQRERMEKEMADGIVAKEVAAKSALLDGQLSGKYSLVAPKHVIGFAQTVVSGGTGSSSGDGRKSVWSGTGASKLSSAPSVVSLEAKVSKLEQSLRMVTSEKVLLGRKLHEIEERDSRGFNGNW